MPVDILIDPGWAVGLLLGITRVAAFVVASPILSRAVPMPARLAVVIAVGAFIGQPVEGPMDTGDLVAAGIANASVGAALGFLTGMIIHLFAVAGGVVDMTSGLAVATSFDPSRGEQGALFSRLFHLTGLSLFFVVGGLELIVRGLAMSVAAVPLASGVEPQAGGLLGVAASLTSKLMIAGIELAFPVLAALFLIEVVLGIASRFAPQANVFLLGLPAKLFIALTMSSAALMLFPETADGALRVMRDAFGDVLRAL